MDRRALEAVIGEVRRDGAGAVELLFEQVVGTEVRVARGKPVGRELAPSARAVARIWRAGRVAEGRGATVAEAVAGAGRGGEPDARGPIERASATDGLSIADRRWGRVGDEERAEIVISAERSVRRVDRTLHAEGFAYAERARLRRYVNSRGVALEETDTTFTVSGCVRGAHGVVVDEEIRSRTFASVASIPLGIRLARRALAVLGPAVRVEGPVRTVLSPLGTASLARIVARRIRDGLPIGTLDPRLHLQDDGLLAGATETRSFDDRGHRPLPLVLVKGGVLGEEYRAGTGHYVDGAHRPTNLVLRAGARTVTASLADLGGDVVVVDSLDRCGVSAEGVLEGRVDALVRRRGRPIGSLRDVRIRGSLARVLGELVELCSDTERIGSVDAPAAIVDGFVLVPAGAAAELEAPG